MIISVCYWSIDDDNDDEDKDEDDGVNKNMVRINVSNRYPSSGIFFW